MRGLVTKHRVLFLGLLATLALMVAAAWFGWTLLRREQCKAQASGEARYAYMLVLLDSSDESWKSAHKTLVKLHGEELALPALFRVRLEDAGEGEQKIEVGGVDFGEEKIAIGKELASVEVVPPSPVTLHNNVPLLFPAMKPKGLDVTMVAIVTVVHDYGKTQFRCLPEKPDANLQSIATAEFKRLMNLKKWKDVDLTPTRLNEAQSAKSSKDAKDGKE